MGSLRSATVHAFRPQKSTNIPNQIFSELVVMSNNDGHVCVCVYMHYIGSLQVTGTQPSDRRTRYAPQKDTRSWHTHQSEVLHRLGEHALVQL